MFYGAHLPVITEREYSKSEYELDRYFIAMNTIIFYYYTAEIYFFIFKVYSPKWLFV